ncbi:MAG: ABC transporter ATP-binding protein [Betaproteobacteria bacterium]
MSHQVPVEAEELHKEYRRGPAEVVHALNGGTMRIEAGRMVAIVGPSGSGKSTLLHLLGCLDRPTAGRIRLLGEETSRLSPRVLPEFRNRCLGFIFQQHYLIPTLTAWENVALPLRYARISSAVARKRACDLLTAVGLADRLHHRPVELSGGQQQRVAIARALACDPPLILADEPTGELDSATTNQVMALLRRLNREGGQTFLIVTHNQEVARACDRVIVLRDGRVVGEEDYLTAPGERGPSRPG